MTLTALDPKPALVVIDLQKGIVSSHTDPSVDDVVKQAANLFPKLGETATTAQILDMLDNRQ
jgi:hypothetical protein